MAHINIGVEGVKELASSIDRKKRGINRSGSLMHRAVILVDRWIQKNFQSEGRLAYPGVGWQPLAPATIAARQARRRYREAAKRRGKPSGAATVRILQDTGQLRGRWKHAWTEDTGIVQSGVDYGVYHDSDEPRRKLPQRKILPTEEQIMPALIKLFRAHIRTNLRR